MKSAESEEIMKKQIFAVSAVLIASALLSGCGKKLVPPGADLFTAQADAAGMQYQDVKDSQYGDVKQIEDAIVAVNSDQTLQNEYYDLDSIESAEVIYGNLMETLGDGMGDSGTSTSKSLANYTAEYKNDGSNFYCIERIDDVVFCSSGSAELSDEGKAFIKAMESAGE